MVQFPETKKTLSNLKIKSKVYAILKNLDSENNSQINFHPFHKGKIKIKEEVVPIGIRVNPKERSDNIVDPSKWNNLLKKKMYILLMLENPLNMRLVPS